MNSSILDVQIHLLTFSLLISLFVLIKKVLRINIFKNLYISMLQIKKNYINEYSYQQINKN